MENKGLLIGLSVLGLGVAGFVGYRIYKRKKSQIPTPTAKPIQKGDADKSTWYLTNGKDYLDILKSYNAAKTEEEKYKALESAIVGSSDTHADMKKVIEEGRKRGYYVESNVEAWNNSSLRKKAMDLLQLAK
jgi:hypothetical protein